MPASSARIARNSARPPGDVRRRRRARGRSPCRSPAPAGVRGRVGGEGQDGAGCSGSPGRRRSARSRPPRCRRCRSAPPGRTAGRRPGTARRRGRTPGTRPAAMPPPASAAELDDRDVAADLLPVVASIGSSRSAVVSVTVQPGTGWARSEASARLLRDLDPQRHRAGGVALVGHAEGQLAEAARGGVGEETVTCAEATAATVDRGRERGQRGERGRRGGGRGGGAGTRNSCSIGVAEARSADREVGAGRGGGELVERGR